MITKKEFLEKRDFYLEEIRNWKIFIYPTDTVLWIWCSIDNFSSIDKIFELKKRDWKPLLIIIPDYNWLENTCILTDENLSFIKQKLPWPYSFVVKLKENNFIYSRINNWTNSVWIRMPDCWFFDIVKEIGVPFITTSVNLSWKPSCLKVEDIPDDILSWVDYVIEEENNMTGKSSTLYDMRWNEKIILRK